MNEKPFRVLLIEDRPGERDQLQQMLSQAGGGAVSVEIAGGPATVLESLAREGFDALVVDASVLHGAGSAVLRGLREEPSAMPVVALASSDEDGRGALDDGAQDYLVKGQFDGQLLARSLRHARALHQLQTELRDLSLTDPLTGLYNRRGFMLLADRYFKLARRAQRSLVVTYIDLDGLEQINAKHGRAEGDQALARVSIILRNHYRESDIMARVAGDEFAFVALGATDRNSEALAARLSEGLRNLTASAPPPYELSLSVGMAWFNPEEPAPVEDLVSQAHTAMDDHRRRKKNS